MKPHRGKTRRGQRPAEPHEDGRTTKPKSNHGDNAKTAHNGQKVKKGDFMRETKKYYAKTSEYNIARILSELAKIIENNNGEIIYTKYSYNYSITNRTINNEILEKKYKIERIEEAQKNPNNDNEKRAEARAKFIEALKRDIEELETKHGDEANTPINCTHLHYIRFVYDGYYYEYDTDENPFFNFYITKAPIIDGEKYDANRYSIIDDKKTWLYDVFFKYGAPEADIKEAANLLFNELVKAPAGELEKERRRIPNTYDNRYHYETIHEKRIKSIYADF